MAVFSSERGKKLQSRCSKVGLAPGTMVFIGEQKIESARINVINYKGNSLNELHDVPHDQCCDLIEASGVTWINVIYCRRLRDEFRTYAGTKVALWIFPGLGRHALCCHRLARLF